MDALRTSTVTGQNPMHGGLKAAMSFHAGRSSVIAEDATPRRAVLRDLGQYVALPLAVLALAVGARDLQARLLL